LKFLIILAVLVSACAQKQIDSSALLSQCTKVCNNKVRDFKTEESGAMACWCGEN